MASRAVAFTYAARRLRNTGALNVGSRASGLRMPTRAEILYGPDINVRGPLTENEAMGLPPFGRGVALLANAIAGTDWAARRADSQTGLQLTLPEQPNIVTDPSPLQTIWQYRWALAVDGILYGNHFALNGELDWRTGRAGWTIPLPADQVWIMTDPASPGWYQWVVGGETFDVDEIFHISFGARSGEILGLGVLQQYAEWLPGMQAAEEYSRDAFAAGALPPAVITVNGAAGQTDLDTLKQKWRQIVNTREPVVLPSGTVVTPIVGNALQAQLVEARTWNAQQAAYVVGVPGWKLDLPGPTMTYQNVETGDIDFIRDSVDRWGRPITESITKWMLPSGTELHWLYESRMRADAKTTAEVFTTYKREGIMTADEVRAKALNLGPLPVTPAPLAQPPTQNTPSEEAAAAADAAASDLAQAGVLQP